MAYLRWGQELPSGNKSNSFVFGSPDGLVNIEKGCIIPYYDLTKYFKTKSDPEIKQELGDKLKLQGEELDQVYKLLMYEKNQGEWD
jgi:hypothetical protein